MSNNLTEHSQSFSSVSYIQSNGFNSVTDILFH